MPMIDATKWDKFYQEMTKDLKPYDHYDDGYRDAMDNVDDWMDGNQVEAEPVRHGRWILEAHNERVNYRWNVTAECSECCDEKKEIYAGFFPGVPDYLAKEVILADAESVKLSNYCPNCGAKMGGGHSNEC